MSEWQPVKETFILVSGMSSGASEGSRMRLFGRGARPTLSRADMLVLLLVWSWYAFYRSHVSFASTRSPRTGAHEVSILTDELLHRVLTTNSGA